MILTIIFYRFTVMVSCDWRSVLISLISLLRSSPSSSSSSLPLRVHLQYVSHFATYHHTYSHDPSLQVIQESTLNNKLVAVPILWSMSPPSPSSSSSPILSLSSLCMHVCKSLCKVVGERCACKCIPLCASNDNVVRACANAILSGWCNACLMIDDCDEWQW